MSITAELITELPAGFDPDKAQWMQFSSSPRFDYPIDYGIAVIAADVAANRIDYLARWSPNAFCHYHRHLGETRAVVLRGEQHVRETKGLETVHKVRRAGFVGHVPDGETHMECAGPEGLMMLFSTYAPDGRLFEVLDKSGTVLNAATIGEFVTMLQANAA
jgi:hypothetical protein